MFLAAPARKTGASKNNFEKFEISDRQLSVLHIKSLLLIVFTNFTFSFIQLGSRFLKSENSLDKWVENKKKLRVVLLEFAYHLYFFLPWLNLFLLLSYQIFYWKLCAEATFLFLDSFLKASN